VRVQIVLSLLLTAVTGSAPANEDPHAADASTPFASRRPGEVVVPVQLGAEGPYRFLLDTGSTHSAVSAAVADGLNLRPVARTTMTASGGSVECLVVALPTVEVGPARLEGLTATELPPAADAALGLDVDGILGQDFLSRFSYTIDYEQSRIRWHDGESTAAATGIRLALVPSQDRFVVELPQRGRKALRLVPDSGADALVLYGEAGRALVSEWLPGTAALDSPTGTRILPRTAIVDGLEIGRTRIGRQPAVILATAAAPGAQDGPDGLLPLHAFASVSFNARQLSLVIRPR
jgi:hypothetical protein